MTRVLQIIFIGLLISELFVLGLALTRFLAGSTSGTDVDPLGALAIFAFLAFTAIVVMGSAAFMFMRVAGKAATFPTLLFGFSALLWIPATIALMRL